MSKMLNSVQEFYKDKVIFITGGSGFMGKVLIEKLLYSCSDVKELIVLMRMKRGKTTSQRVQDFEKLPMFKRIMDEKPEVMKRIHIVNGEISEPNLGLCANDLNYIIENAHIIFHLAASLKLEATLKPNIIANLTATKRVIDIAKQMKHLLAMIHTSTAFCNVERRQIEEKVYDTPHRPMDLINSAEWMHEDVLAKVQTEILGVHQNTYTYTKRLAEILVRDEYESSDLPLCIARPSIVSCALNEPVVGWVDSLNGPPGIIIAGSKGVLRTLFIDKDAGINIVPVDVAINALIMIGKEIATTIERPKDVPVYHINVHESKVIPYKYLASVVESMRYEVAPGLMIWYPNVTLTTNRIYYMIRVFLFQWIPAYFVDFLFLVFRQQRFMVKVQNMIYVGIDALKCFTFNNWEFQANNFKKLIKQQSKEEYDMFFLDTKTVNVEEYIRGCVIGGRVYCAKDPLSTAPRGRILMRILYVVDRLVKFLFFYWIMDKILTYAGLMEPIMGIGHKLFN